MFSFLVSFVPHKELSIKKERLLILFFVYSDEKVEQDLKRLTDSVKVPKTKLGMIRQLFSSMKGKVFQKINYKDGKVLSSAGEKHQPESISQFSML